MSEKTNVVHIGLHKSGSTTLQRALFEIASTIKERGFLYPLGHLPARIQHSDLAMYLRGGENSLYRKAMDAIVRDVELSSNAALLLSGEEFSTLSISNIAAFHSDLEKTGKPTRIVLYVRNLYRFALSLISQHSKSGKFIAYPSEVIARLAQFNPSLLLANWESVFGSSNVTVFCLDTLPSGAKMVDQFAAFAGLTLPANVKEQRMNRSVDPIASAVLTHLAFEFGVSHRAFYDAYFEVTRDRILTPRIDAALLSKLTEWVEEVNLSHPKVAKFQEFLRQKPEIGLHGAPELPTQQRVRYMRDLAAVLERTADRTERTGR